jgi:hypothetical protein
MMTSTERRRLEAQYRGPFNAHAELAKCAVGLLVIVSVAATAAAGGGDDDAAKAALSVPRVVSGR